MSVPALGHAYPEKTVSVVTFPGSLTGLLSQPPGLFEDGWPPLQVSYLSHYLAELGCRTVLIESHYIDRDYIQDLSFFFARSLRSYPNFCQRFHFFSSDFDQAGWVKNVAGDVEARIEFDKVLQSSYLGFSVIRPLPGSPIGRTVLKTFGPTTAGESRREFGGVRSYTAHLGGYELKVEGLAFQQQDQAVSACATAALWSSIHGVAYIEGLPVPSPAEITEAASRYLLAGGRPLPSEGLTIQQICEATRAAGLAPVVIQGVSIEHERAQLLGYIRSGFPVVVAIKELQTQEGHAVCAVGLRLGEILPQTNPGLSFRDAASAVQGVYIHDDRLGPYASGDLYSVTTGPGVVRTGLRIRWPGEATEAEHSIVHALVVPLPPKVRLTVARMRALGHSIAQGAADVIFSELKGKVVLDCRYRLAVDYCKLATSFGLSEEGLYSLLCGTVLSRHIGIIELQGPEGPLLDVVLDSTEGNANPAVLAVVARAADSNAKRTDLDFFASWLGAKLII